MADKIRVFPKVYLAGKKQKIFISITDCENVKIRVQGMESYTVPHKTYRIDEDCRYEFSDMEKAGESLFSFEYEFKREQKYSLTFRFNGKEYVERVYAVKGDLAGLKVFKGDTHLHTNYSDGEGTPFEVGINYRKKGFDFIAITDHHRFYPSLEGQEEFKKLTDEFFVFRGEEVHNRDMGYFHVINFNGEKSVNTVIEESPEYMKTEVEKMLKTTRFSRGVDALGAAQRIFIANEIRKVGGIAVLAHPFWDAYGEYNAQTDDIKFLLKGGYFDAVEVFAGNDHDYNGDNLASALYFELKAKGLKVGLVGCSDAHSEESENSLFNKVFTLAFAKDFNFVPSAIKSGDTVAVHYRSDKDFWVFGNFRLVKYARFLLAEYFPYYATLCKEHALTLDKRDAEKIKKSEEKLKEFKKRFFAFY